MPGPVRSLLFVPGSRPERWEKALAAGADCICIDLEDAVIPSDKNQARADVISWLSQQEPEALPCQVGVRINGLTTLAGVKDLAAFAGAEVLPDFLMLPKAENVGQIEQIKSVLRDGDGAYDQPGLWTVIESPRGVAVARDIAEACAGGAAGKSGILFGGADYSAALGVSMDWEPLFHARTSIIHAAADFGGLALLDVPYLDVKNDDGLREACFKAKALGFRGKACIHPGQVACVNEAFSPSEAEISWAKRVMAAEAAAAGNAVLLDGKLLDLPVYIRAQRILEYKE